MREAKVRPDCSDRFGYAVELYSTLLRGACCGGQDGPREERRLQKRLLAGKEGCSDGILLDAPAHFK